MTPALRNLAADLLALYGGLPDSGDGISLDALPPADREAIEVLIWADPLYDPDGADAPHPGCYGLWPTGKVCRALGEMMRTNSTSENADARPSTVLALEAADMLDAMSAMVCPVMDLKTCAGAIRSVVAEVARLRGEVDALMGAMVGQACGSWYAYDRCPSHEGARASDRPHRTREQAVAAIRTRLGMDGGDELSGSAKGNRRRPMRE